MGSEMCIRDSNEVAQKTYESIGFREDTEFKNYVLPISEEL